MAKKCSICSHRNHDQIDQLIVQKTPYRTIAEKFKIKAKDPVQAIKNHVRYGHISKQIQKAQEKVQESEEVRQGLELGACAKDIYDLSMGAAKLAKEEDLRAFGGCIGPAIKVLELLKPGEGKQDEPSKESGFMAGYMKRAAEIYEKPQSPPN
jgi:hypothetical protein